RWTSSWLALLALTCWLAATGAAKPLDEPAAAGTAIVGAGATFGEAPEALVQAPIARLADSESGRTSERRNARERKRAGWFVMTRLSWCAWRLRSDRSPTASSIRLAILMP